METSLKKELPEASSARNGAEPSGPVPVIELSSGGSDSDSDAVPRKKVKVSEKTTKMMELDGLGLVVQPGFLRVLPPSEAASALASPTLDVCFGVRAASGQSSCKQFWKAGDYEGAPSGDWGSSTGNLSVSLPIVTFFLFTEFPFWLQRMLMKRYIKVFL